MDPATISAIASILPLILGLFGGDRERDPTAVFNQLNSLLGAQFQPILQAAMQLASSEGARVGQDISGSVGRAAGGGTGIGAVSRSVGAGLASSRASEARLGVGQAQLSLLAQLFPSFLNPGQKPPGTLQNVQSAVGLSQLGGKNPFMELLNLFKQTPTTKAQVRTPAPYTPSFTLPRGIF